MNIKEMISEAFDMGFHGCYESLQDAVDEIIRKHVTIRHWRIWTVEELNQLPNGTQFNHYRLGIGTIMNYEMKFANESYSFNKNARPWDELMSIVSYD